MTGPLTLTIAGRLPGLNEYVAACRSNAYAGAKLKQEAEQIVCWAIRQQLRGVVVDTPVTVRFAWHEQNRRRDLDNVAFAKKFVLDALQTCGVLQGDGWRQVRGLSDRFAVDKQNPRVVVTIAAANNPEIPDSWKEGQN